MTATGNSIDPFGVQPIPFYGDPAKDETSAPRQAHAAAVEAFFKTNWIDHPPQEQLVESILAYFASVQSRRGLSMDGRRLSEYSNAGKTRMIERVLAVAAARRAERGLTLNPHQILHIEFDRSSSVRRMLRLILKELGDEHWNDPRAELDELEERVAVLSVELGCEGCIVDEVQHLDRKNKDATQISDTLKTWLNRGILPLVLIGDELADKFFEKNDRFAARLGIPMKLRPMDFRHVASERKMLKNFFEKIDDDLVGARLTLGRSGLDGPAIRTPLARACGGHVGRACRIVDHAARNAALRGSPVIEPYDLSVSVRDFAFPAGWSGNDPFSKRSPPTQPVWNGP